MEKDRTGVAEYFVDEVRNALLIEQVPDGPVDRFLLPGPSLPVSGGGRRRHGLLRRRDRPADLELEGRGVQDR